MEKLAAEIKYIREKIDMLIGAVIGDLSDPEKPGHGIRIDRIEQSLNTFKKLFWVLSGGIILAILQQYL